VASRRVEIRFLPTRLVSSCGVRSGRSCPYAGRTRPTPTSQDGCVLHADPGFPAVVGEGWVVGHNAVVHGCEIGAGCLVGMGATVLNGARIGAGSIVAAGTLVPENKEFPPHSLIVGVPAKRVKDVSGEQTADIARGVRTYVERAASHRLSLQRR
jgi:carbonic anhydrase/acetyltransferase-like protein (isoleucine patch superfamily)